MIGLGSDKKNCWLQLHIRKIWKWKWEIVLSKFTIYETSLMSKSVKYILYICQPFRSSIFDIDLICAAWFELICDKQEWLFFATPYFSLFATAYFSARLVARLQVVIGGGQGSTARGGREETNFFFQLSCSPSLHNLRIEAIMMAGERC